MREILFRGKRTYNGEWVEGVYLGDYFDDKSSYYIRYCLENYRVFLETVGQFTELCDKNGKKIFEGDILRNVETGEIGYVDYEWHGCPNFVVETDDGCLHYTTLFIETPDDDMEIIGNKFDNPELIPIYKASEYKRY